MAKTKNTTPKTKATSPNKAKPAQSPVKPTATPKHVALVVLRCGHAPPVKKQRAALQAYAEKCGHPVKWHTFRIPQTCGGNDDFAEVARVLSADEQAGAVVFFDLFCPDQRGFVEFFTLLTMENQKFFVVLEQGVDTSTPQGLVMAWAAFGLATLQTVERHRRTAIAQREAMATRPRRWKPMQPRTIAKVDDVRRLAATGLSLTKIACRTELSAPTCRKILTSRIR